MRLIVRGAQYIKLISDALRELLTDKTVETDSSHVTAFPPDIVVRVLIPFMMYT